MSGLKVEGADQLRVLAARLKAADAALLRSMRADLKTATVPVQAAVRSKAAGFSTTIPGAVTARTRFSKRNAVVEIRVVAKKLKPGHEPLARLEEFGSKGRRGVIRHPVYGNRSNWVNQPSHPFFYPTIRGAAPGVRLSMFTVMRETSAVAGFK